MDPLNCIREKDSTEHVSLLHEFEPSENCYLGSYDPAVDHHPLDEINACIDYDLFMQILEEDNVPERAKKNVVGICMKGSLEYAQQRESKKMKNVISVAGTIEKRKVITPVSNPDE
ncbi:hypothetical protein NL676_013442 [Syzygium grande]|nr:hypothetical protein NL676_013442 [Syzygium grande]